MCDSSLHQVIELLDEGRVIARDLNGATHAISLLAYDGEAPGEGSWLIVHSGYAIARAGPQDAAEAIAELSRACAVDAEVKAATLRGGNRK